MSIGIIKLNVVEVSDNRVEWQQGRNGPPLRGQSRKSQSKCPRIRLDRRVDTGGGQHRERTSADDAKSGVTSLDDDVELGFDVSVKSLLLQQARLRELPERWMSRRRQRAFS